MIKQLLGMCLVLAIWVGIFTCSAQPSCVKADITYIYLPIQTSQLNSIVLVPIIYCTEYE